MSSDLDYQSVESDNEEVPIQRELNVIVFGESGVGKSAIINQIYDKEIVRSSDQAVGCTVDNARVSGTIKDFPGIKLHIYDTAGLSESEEGQLPTAQAFVQLIKLSYVIPNGIHLLICCHKKGRIATEQFKANYRIYKEELCENRIPCLLVITHCDTDEPLNGWWINNKQIIRDKLKFHFIDGVCVSTERNTRHEPNKITDEYEISRRNLIQAIIDQSLSKPVSIDSWKRKVLVYARELYNAVAKYFSWIGFQQRSLRPELEKMFINLGKTPQEAQMETEKLLKEIQEKPLMACYDQKDA